MKTTLCAFIFAMLGIAAVPALASPTPRPVPQLTGGWPILTEDGGGGSPGPGASASVGIYADQYGNPTPPGLFYFESDAVITSFSESGNCPGTESFPFDTGIPNCVEQWEGTAAGTVHLAALFNPDTTLNYITAVGRITSATFSGEAICDSWPSDDCGFGTQVDMTFTAQWSNGWQSTGGADWDASAFGTTTGGIGMTTVDPTPEPASMALLGSGIIAAACRMRKRQS
jgi:hypothetical protein